ncbi:Halomucin [Symbiodinium microadriaticum]|uniref:Halomucin n=1 Tax=Symbiodinium microadriaticum TaxID=2951 RepID=A0A1Q9D2Z3_SYMMI|nr:Halomucin [Symbiodinium microadriaticum]
MEESVEVFVNQDGVDTCSFDVPLTATVQEVLEGACHPGCGFVRNLRCLHIRAMVGSVAQGCAERPPDFESDDSDDSDDSGSGGDGDNLGGDGDNLGVHRLFLSNCMGIIRTASSDDEQSGDANQKKDDDKTADAIHKQDDDKTADANQKQDDDKHGDDSQKQDDDKHGDDSQKDDDKHGDDSKKDDDKQGDDSKKDDDKHGEPPEKRSRLWCSAVPSRAAAQLPVAVTEKLHGHSSAAAVDGSNSRSEVPIAPVRDAKNMIVQGGHKVVIMEQVLGFDKSEAPRASVGDIGDTPMRRSYGIWSLGDFMRFIFQVQEALREARAPGYWLVIFKVKYTDWVQMHRERTRRGACAVDQGLMNLQGEHSGN